MLWASIFLCVTFGNTIPPAPYSVTQKSCRECLFAEGSWCPLHSRCYPYSPHGESVKECYSNCSYSNKTKFVPCLTEFRDCELPSTDALLCPCGEAKHTCSYCLPVQNFSCTNLTDYCPSSLDFFNRSA